MPLCSSQIEIRNSNIIRACQKQGAKALEGRQGEGMRGMGRSLKIDSLFYLHSSANSKSSRLLKKINLFIYLFIFGCVGSSLPLAGFL